MLRSILLISLTLASQASFAQDAMTGTTTFGTNHFDELLSTSKALTKITLVIQTYKCESAVKDDEKKEKCATSNATKKAIETLGSTESLRDDSINLIASDGKHKTVYTNGIKEAALKSDPEFFKDMSDVEIAARLLGDIEYAIYK